MQLTPRPLTRRIWQPPSIATGVSSRTGAVSKIVLAAGTYELDSDMCDTSAICIDRAVTIEAEVPGSVVLDAKGSASTNRRVFNVQSSGAAELIGLNITGGYVDVCSHSAPSGIFPPSPH